MTKKTPSKQSGEDNSYEHLIYKLQRQTEPNIDTTQTVIIQYYIAKRSERYPMTDFSHKYTGVYNIHQNYKHTNQRTVKFVRGRHLNSAFKSLSTVDIS